MESLKIILGVIFICAGIGLIIRARISGKMEKQFSNGGNGTKNPDHAIMSYIFGLRSTVGDAFGLLFIGYGIDLIFLR